MEIDYVPSGSPPIASRSPQEEIERLTNIVTLLTAQVNSLTDERTKLKDELDVYKQELEIAHAEIRRLEIP